MSNHDNYDIKMLKAIQSIANSLKVIERNLCMGSGEVKVGYSSMCESELIEEKEVYNNDKNSGEMR